MSRSYRKVADFIMSNYYDVSFMTAAQLAYAVGVDTTTVVRFSQRLGFNGYPDLLNDIRNQVRNEVYAAYEPKQLRPDDPAAIFRERAKQEEHNLRQMLIHNPPEHIQRIAAQLERATEVVLIAEGYANTVAEMAAQQCRHRGIPARSVDADPVKRAATLMSVSDGALVIGISATAYGHDVARAMEYLRAKGCATIGVVGSLESPVNRVSDQVMYAPTDIIGPLPDIVMLVAALASLVHIASKESDESTAQYREEFERTYTYLTESDRFGGGDADGSDEL
ncbi:MAG: MurR/RpiR family transcriptional regulator [Caldilineaceae bacterium]|nr:MurR/RpiR family transcriptional regulator [Caldilineaceae bacterium]